MKMREEAEPWKRTKRKAYESPRLTCFGDLAAVTRSGGNLSGDIEGGSFGAPTIDPGHRPPGGPPAPPGPEPLGGGN